MVLFKLGKKKKEQTSVFGFLHQIQTSDKLLQPAGGSTGPLYHNPHTKVFSPRHTTM